MRTHILQELDDGWRVLRSVSLLRLELPLPHGYRLPEPSSEATDPMKSRSSGPRLPHTTSLISDLSDDWGGDVPVEKFDVSKELLQSSLLGVREVLSRFVSLVLGGSLRLDDAGELYG